MHQIKSTKLGYTPVAGAVCYILGKDS